MAKKTKAAADHFTITTYEDSIFREHDRKFLLAAVEAELNGGCIPLAGMDALHAIREEAARIRAKLAGKPL
jgi:hypothetical protein